ncbi:MAG: type 4a pilus biogenesis protein PilO [Candidatus Berkelbacteria bacterium]|nr:type 4a pilus biogenesis protein PilO [Candidatus Berkelbacteria bacterium]
MQRQTNNWLYLYLLPAMIVIGCFWYSYAVLLPTHQTQKQKLAQINADIKDKDDQLQGYTTAKSSLNSSADTIKDLALAVPSDKDVPNLITELEKMSRKYGSVIPSIQWTDTTTGVVNISFSISGSVSGMQSFVKDIETDLRVFNIKNMSVAASPDGISLSLQIEAYKNTYSAASTSVSAAAR